jgi:cytochrome b561
MASALLPYDRVSVLLHWSIALLILFNWAISGLVQPAPPAQGNLALILHVTAGLTVLVLSVVRVGWRLAHPWPPLPAAMPDWEKLVARANHVAFYVLILAIPLLGWATASAAPGLERLLYLGFIPWPQLPIADSEARMEMLEGWHGLGVNLLLALLALHVAGALKGTYRDRFGTLGRMIPGLLRADSSRSAKPDPRRL